MNKDNVYFFGEKASFTNEKEKIEAKEYLDRWKDNLLKKLYTDCYSAEIVDSQTGVRPPEYSGCLCITSWMWLKVAVRIKFQFETEGNDFYNLR